MVSPVPVLLILGGGANIGKGVARAFASKGYKVASTSRTAQEGNGKDGIDLHIQADVGVLESVSNVFQQVRKALGPPTVVVYNAYAAVFNPADDPLALLESDLSKDLQVNTISVLAAAREAKADFETMPATASRVFIYTGNALNLGPMGPLYDLGIGKSASAHLIQGASQAYADKGYKFYYADERQASGAPAGGAISGEAHGNFYIELAERKTEVPWLATFVKGTGYVDFTKKV